MLLLEYNSDSLALLDWVVDRCYTGTHEVADGCFNALAIVFNNRYREQKFIITISFN